MATRLYTSLTGQRKTGENVHTHSLRQHEEQLPGHEEELSMWTHEVISASCSLSEMTATGANQFPWILMQNHKISMQPLSDSLQGLQDNCTQGLEMSSGTVGGFPCWEMQTGRPLSSPTSLPWSPQCEMDAEDWYMTPSFGLHTHIHVTCAPATYTKEQDGATDFSFLSLVYYLFLSAVKWTQGPRAFWVNTAPPD